MALFDKILNRIRLELGDEPYPFEASFLADGIEFQYPLDHHPLKEGSVVVTRDGQPFTGYELDHRHGVMLFPEPPVSGTTFFAAGIRYKYFNDDDLSVFAKEAVAEHSLNAVDVYGINQSLEDIPVVQHHVIAMRASILALWALATDASFDIDISAPDGVHIPRGQRFAQIMGILQGKQAEHDALAKALNVGVFRTEVFTLRRIAKRTNRLVPLYMTQEYDDSRPPTRLYTESSTQGNELPVEKVPTIDLVLRRGEMFVHEIDISRNVRALVGAEAVFAAEVLRYPGQTVPRAVFELEPLDLEAGRFRLSMNARMSRSVPNTQSYWQLVARADKETIGSILLAQGRVKAERGVASAANVVNESFLGG